MRCVSAAHDSSTLWLTPPLAQNPPRNLLATTVPPATPGAKVVSLIPRPASPSRVSLPATLPHIAARTPPRPCVHAGTLPAPLPTCCPPHLGHARKNGWRRRRLEVAAAESVAAGKAVRLRVALFFIFIFSICEHTEQRGLSGVKCVRAVQVERAPSPNSTPVAALAACVIDARSMPCASSVWLSIEPMVVLPWHFSMPNVFATAGCSLSQHTARFPPG